MSRSLNLIPDSIQVIEPAISRCLVADSTPDPFLHIQTGLIAREIFNPQPNVSLEEDFDFFSLMPPRPVHIEPDCITLKPPVDIPKTGNESFTVALRHQDKSFLTQKGSDPAENIESSAMVAIGGDTKSLSSLRPPHTNPGMQREAGLILKGDCLLMIQQPEFFLKQRETSLPLSSLPEDRNSWPVSDSSPAGASNTALDELLTLSQMNVLDEQLKSGHPNGRDLTRIPMAASLIAPLTFDEFVELIGQDGQVFAWIPENSNLPRSPCASRHSSSDASNLRCRLSMPDADPPVSAIKPLSLFQHRLPALLEQRLRDALGLPADALALDFSYIEPITDSLKYQFIYCVCINKIIIEENA